MPQLATKAAPAEERQETPPELNPDGMLAAIRALAPMLAECADEAERDRRPPPPAFHALAATGIFRMLRPVSRGGGGFTLAQALPVIEALAEADGSAAWSTMIGVESAALWMRFARFEPVASSPERGVLTRASLIPRGVARETAAGWRLTGHWPLASGAYVPDWFIAAGIVMDDDKPRLRDDGLPDARLFAVAPDQVEVVETWRALGLRSTMSDDIKIDALIPDERTAPGLGVIDSAYPLGRLPVWFALGPFHCAVAIGLVRGALGEVAALLPTKRPVLNPTIRTCEDPFNQHVIGLSATRLDSARAFLMSEVARAWAMAEEQAEFAPFDRVRFRSMLAFIHAECSAIMDQLFALAGSTPLYDGAPLQRRYRDLRAACQHVTASPEIYRPYGAMMMDVPVPNAAAL